MRQINPDHLNLINVQSFENALSEGFLFRKNSKPYLIEFPLDWALDPFNDRNWCFNLHGWRPMDCAIRSWRRNGNAQALKFCLELALDWHRHHVAEGRNSEFAFYDMATGLRASRLAFLIERVREGELGNDASVIVKLEMMADIHCARLSDEKFLSKGNHGIFQIVGLHHLAGQRKKGGKI